MVRELAGLDPETHSNSCYGICSVLETFVLWPLYGLHTCDLGTRLHKEQGEAFQPRSEGSISFNNYYSNYNNEILGAWGVGCPRGRLKLSSGKTGLCKKVCDMRQTFLETSGRPGWAGSLHHGTSTPALPSFFHSFSPPTATLTQFKGFNTIRLRKWFF